MSWLDIDKMLLKAAAKSRESFIGKPLGALSSKGSASALALLNILFTSILGFAMVYPVRLAGGSFVSFFIGLSTLAIVLILFASILHARLGFSGPVQRKLLALAIFFSLPFGLLSLPLLYKMSKQ